MRWSEEPAVGSEAVLRPLLMPTVIISNEWLLYTYMLVIVLIFNKKVKKCIFCVVLCRKIFWPQFDPRSLY
uniref:Uncharacterized protein n=1 Tax=Lepeophtheirus salmonis TaxID=72036 RepID=A0A0K2U9I2_LEPSM